MLTLNKGGFTCKTTNGIVIKSFLLYLDSHKLYIMKLNKIVFSISLLLATGLVSSCNQNSDKRTPSIDTVPGISVYNFSNKLELATYNKLNLDESHPNLLNPQISKTDHNAIIDSWTDLHQKIGSYLSQNDFSWEVEDSTISIVQKIYFKPNGAIKHYFFNVLNKSITEEKKVQFSNLIIEFAKRNQIAIKRDKPFAQCGKTKYLNK